MTTVPLDDAAVDAPVQARDDPAALPEDPGTGASGGASGGSEAEADGAAPARWRLLARWKAAGHRVLPGVSYPISLYVVWRLAIWR